MYHILEVSLCLISLFYSLKTMPIEYVMKLAFKWWLFHQNLTVRTKVINENIIDTCTPGFSREIPSKNLQNMCTSAVSPLYCPQN